MASGFKENAEDLNTGDSVQVDRYAVRAEPAELAAIRERVDRDFVTDPGSVSGELAAELMQARIDRRALLANFDAELAEHAKPAPEMPRPPAEEAQGHQPTFSANEHRTTVRCECGWTDAASCGPGAKPLLERVHANHVTEMVAEGTRPAAQPGAGGTETSGTGSGRGTGVAEATGTAQGSDDA